MSNIDLDIVHVCFEFKNPILLDESDLNCFKKNKPEIVLTNNWLKIRNEQSDDLLLLFNNFFFETILLSPNIENNVYKFSLMLIFKKNINWSDIKNFDFKFIKINTFYKVYSQNITHQFFKLFLNFPISEKYCFKRVDTVEWKTIHDSLKSGNYSSKFTNSPEYTNYENYLKFQKKNFNKIQSDLREENDCIFFLYKNLYHHKLFEPKYLNYNVFLKNCFSQLTISWCFLNYEWKDEISNKIGYGYTYPVNELCYATQSMYSNSPFSNDCSISLEEYAAKHTVNDYNFTCMFDILSCDFPGYSFDEFEIFNSELNYNILKYKTCYKTFLDQKK